MARPTTLLEELCGRALKLGAESIEVEYDHGFEQVVAFRGFSGIGIARYASTSADANELRQSLSAAVKKPVRTTFDGRAYVLTVRVFDSFGEEAFRVDIKPAHHAASKRR